MGFGRSGSASNKLGRLALGHQTCPRGSYLFLAHTSPSSFSPPSHSQLEESAREMVLPLTSSLYLLTFATAWPQRPVHDVSQWQNRNRQAEGRAVDEASSAFGIAVTCCQFSPFATSSAILI
ncbi:unnamed protein product [Rangifer tarandus platyrhynchus]|uniref:Uncharacterized protein n=1 Tax=Rangifer tarandus platyrhynchus TaxID=3082113 RepID=A0ABN8Y1H5_RANTA|nr:unnamed protein product [Rangifer tarandus platyrhynchus]